jgi:hypothetical protein
MRNGSFFHFVLLDLEVMRSVRAADISWSVRLPARGRRPPMISRTRSQERT